MDNKESVQTIILGIMGLLILLGASPQGVVAKGFVYKDPVYNYSIRFPGGWKRIPQKELLVKMEEIIQSNPGSAELMRKIAVGFYVEDNGYSQYPYIFIFYNEAELPTFDEIAEAHGAFDMNKEFDKLKKEYKTHVEDAKAGSVFVDKRKKIIFRTSQAEVVGVGDVAVLTAFCVGKNRYTVINCYSEASEFSKTFPTFKSIIETFAFEFGYAYEDMYHIENKYWRMIMKSRLIPVIAAGLGVFLIVYFRKKRRDKLRTKRELSEMDTQK